MQNNMMPLDADVTTMAFDGIAVPDVVPAAVEETKPKPKKKKDEAMEGRVVFVDAYRHVIGIERDGIGYQVCADKALAVGDKVKFTMKDGAILLK